MKGKFEKLALGAIRPAGWIKNQIEIQAMGFTGHLDEYWDDLGPNSAWLGGDGEGWERGPYYLDGLVPLAYLLDDQTLINKARKWVEWILNSQQSDGWYGPTTNDDWWPRMIVSKVLIQYYEVTKDNRVIPFLTYFYRYQLKHLAERPLNDWAKVRGGENILSLVWLYEQTHESFILDVIELTQQQSTNWAAISDDFPFTRYMTEFNHESHVVNVVMALKYLGLQYQITGDMTYYDKLKKLITNIDYYHGQVTGVPSGDEWLAGTSPSQGTELCAVVEYMFSMETLLAIFGDAQFGDKLERVAFNALPAAISRDWQSHQYDQQVNQISCTVAQRNWTSNNDESNTFGLEPNFGCCTANMHQAWPKFVSSLWMKQGQSTYVCQSQVPCHIQDGSFEASVSSNYPFNLNSTITLTGTWEKLLIRIPEWSQDVKLTMNGQHMIPKITDHYLEIQHHGELEMVICLELIASVVRINRPKRATAVSFGALLFSLGLTEKWSKYSGKEPFENWEVTTTDEWNYGLPEHSEFKIKYTDTLKKQVFDSLHSPITIQTIGYEVKNWQVKINSADEPPYHCEVDAKKQLSLVHYGGAKLRITEFPTITDR